MILSAVRETQLALLFHRVDTNEMEIRIPAKIEHNAVLWSNLLKVDMTPFSGQFRFNIASFFMDAKKKVVVIFGNDRKMRGYNNAYVIGEEGYYKEVSRRILLLSKCVLLCSKFGEDTTSSTLQENSILASAYFDAKMVLK